MNNLCPEIAEAYARALENLDDEILYGDEIRLSIGEVLKAHFLIVDFFYQEGINLGGIGPRDWNLLNSALYRQHTGFGDFELYENNFQTIGTLFFGLIKDHPFHDANKRTALLCLLYQLEKLGRCPTVSKKELEEFTVLVADNGLSKFSRYLSLKKISSIPEVDYIAWFLRTHSRIINKRQYVVTFRDLDKILKRFGFALINENKNFIDVVRTEERRKLFGFGKKEIINVKVSHIGFPGWSKQVTPGGLKKIRRDAQLDYRHGIDSETFFKGADPIELLISEYQEPLRALANK